MKHIVITGNAAGAQTDAHKQHPSDAQRNAFNLQLAQ